MNFSAQSIRNFFLWYSGAQQEKNLSTRPFTQIQKVKTTRALFLDQLPSANESPCYPFKGFWGQSQGKSWVLFSSGYHIIPNTIRQDYLLLITYLASGN